MNHFRDTGTRDEVCPIRDARSVPTGFEIGHGRGFGRWESHSVLRQERGWKLFFLVPRMLLSRPPRGGLIPRNMLESRLTAFAAGHWIELIDASGEMCWKAKEAMVRRSRRQGSMDMKVARAERLAMMGELSAARQVVESADLAPGNNATHRALTRQDRRPALVNLLRPGRTTILLLDDEKFAKNLRSARRGAAQAHPA